VAEMGLLAEVRNQHISLDVVECVAKTDPVLFRQALQNLVDNAIKFSPEGGVIRISLREDDNGCTVEVGDAGPGIPDDAKSKIFTPFFTSRAKGMGLGLSIVKGIVEAHHGRICETGNQGDGARFIIFLPAAGDRR